MRQFVLTLAVALTALRASASLIPVIANAGFEETSPGNDAPCWGWYARARTSFRSSTDNPHSGGRCLVLTDASPLAPEVYGRLYQGVGVSPGTKYELSVWVRAKNASKGLHFTDWSSYTLDIPEGTYGWRKISAVFTTKAGESGLNVGLNMVNVCEELAIDDVSLRPVGVTARGSSFEAELIAPGQVIGDNAESSIALILTEPAKTRLYAEAAVLDGPQTLFRQRSSIEPQQDQCQWKWNTGATASSTLKCTVRVTDASGRPLAYTSAPVGKISPNTVSRKLNEVQRRKAAFDSLYDKCAAKGIRMDYPDITRTMLRQFIPLARKDARTGELRRAEYAIRDFDRALDSGMALMKAYLEDPSLAPFVHRYQTGKMSIDGVSFIAERRDSSGRLSRGPVFFNGYGHFGQVRKDIRKFPGYGVNIIQIEIGPAITFTTESETSLRAAREIVDVLDLAALYNVKVNILLSEHYFPQWAMEKWPRLGKGGGGFLGFCVDEPEAKQVVERFLRTVIPMFKDKPALHSFCLSNEPIFDRSAGCDLTRGMWDAYLEKTHGSAQTLNERYGTSYRSFAEVPIPGNDAYDAPQFYDWCVFVQERFAGWHRWMADVIHSMAPDVPVHAKAMWVPISWRGSITWGLDPELFGQALEINGNDCAIWPGGDGRTIAWGEQNMYYDLQRSVARKPIFNSENHLQPDGSTYYVAPEHYRTALWQGAIHGQGATTIWVWERAVPGQAWTGPFYGNVMDRPGCAEEVGRTCLDLNRYAEEVTALQNAASPVAVVFSIATHAKNSGYLAELSKAYGALNFLGVKVDFITDRQLASGKAEGYKLVVLPGTTHLPAGAVAGLSRASGKVRLAVLGPAPVKDPYGRPHPAETLAFLEGALKMYPDSTQAGIEAAFRSELEDRGALPDLSLLDAATGRPVQGVEWLTATASSRMVVNMVNLSGKPVRIRIERAGKEVRPVNLLSLGRAEPVQVLQPLVPVLARVDR